MNQQKFNPKTVKEIKYEGCDFKAKYPLIAFCMLLLSSLACSTDTSTTYSYKSSATIEPKFSSESVVSGEIIVNKNANLREGPGTTYKIIGGAKANQRVKVIGKNSAGDWYQLDNQAWIAAFLINGVPDVPIVRDSSNSQVLTEDETSENLPEFVPIEAFGVFSGVKVYYGKGKDKAYGFEIVGGSNNCLDMPDGKGVKVRYSNGTEEWKPREYIVTSGLYFYIKDDPAAQAFEWYEYSDC